MHKGLLLCVSFSFQSDSFYLIYLESLKEALGSGEGIGTDSYWMLQLEFCAMAPCSGRFAHIILRKSHHSLMKWVSYYLSEFRSNFPLCHTMSHKLKKKTPKLQTLCCFHCTTFLGSSTIQSFMGIFFLPMYSSTTFHWITTSGAVSYFCLYFTFIHCY